MKSICRASGIGESLSKLLATVAEEDQDSGVREVAVEALAKARHHQAARVALLRFAMADSCMARVPVPLPCRFAPGVTALRGATRPRGSLGPPTWSLSVRLLSAASGAPSWRRGATSAPSPRCWGCWTTGATRCRTPVRGGESGSDRRSLSRRHRTGNGGRSGSTRFRSALWPAGGGAEDAHPGGGAGWASRELLAPELTESKRGDRDDSSGLCRTSKAPHRQAPLSKMIAPLPRASVKGCLATG